MIKLTLTTLLRLSNVEVLNLELEKKLLNVNINIIEAHNIFFSPKI